MNSKKKEDILKAYAKSLIEELFPETSKPIKDSWSKEEVVKLLQSYMSEFYDDVLSIELKQEFNTDKWIEENL